MRRAIVAFSFAAILAVSAQAQLFVEETFDYGLTLAPDDNIAGASGGTGFTGAWYNTRNSPDYDEPGNTAGDLAVVGGRVKGNAWSGIARPIGSTLSSSGLLDDGATLWMSVIFDLTGANTTNADLNIALTDSTQFWGGGGSINFARRENLAGTTVTGVGITHSGGFIQGVSWRDAGVDETPNADPDDGFVNDTAERTETPNSSLRLVAGGGPNSALIVAEINWGADAFSDETITLYNPDSSLNLGAPILAATPIAALDQSVYNTIALQFKDRPWMDEIRIGATAADVLPSSGGPTPLAGDFNGDGTVDAADYTVYADNLGQADESAFAAGTGDGMNGVDSADYDLWRANFGNTTPPLLGGGGGAVPEPGTIALLAGGLGLGLIALRNRRK